MNIINSNWKIKNNTVYLLIIDNPYEYESKIKDF
jgi:hypothetical protein